MCVGPGTCSKKGWVCSREQDGGVLRTACTVRMDGGALKMNGCALRRDGGAGRMDGGALRTEGTCTDMGRWTSNWQLEGQLLC